MDLRLAVMLVAALYFSTTAGMSIIITHAETENFGTKMFVKKLMP